MQPNNKYLKDQIILNDFLEKRFNCGHLSESRTKARILDFGWGVTLQQDPNLL